jgi:DUF4097 and DUF4098 domain-containing protein YvlB
MVLGQGAREIRKTLPLGSDGTVSIETFKGSVTITTWDSPQVEILARIEPDGASSIDAEKVQKTDVRIESSAGGIQIKSDYEKLKNAGFGSDDNEGNLPLINYTIKMPGTARLDIRDHKSITRVDGLRSAVKINTHRGSVSVTGFQGSIDLQTHRGDARVEFASLGRENRFESHRGEIDVVVPRGGGFNLESSVGKGGSLESDLDLKSLVQSQDRRSTRYGGAVNGGGPLLHLVGDKAHFRLQQQ